MISESKLIEIRRSLYNDDGYTRINNPHFDLIFEEAFKAGMNHVNNGVLDDVSKATCKNCGKTKDKHTEASRMCPNGFYFFEVYC